MRTDDRVKMILGIAGAVLLLIGVFLPFARMPVLESLGLPYVYDNYFNSGYGDGMIVCFLAAASFFLVLVKLYQGLWLTGLGSLACLVFAFINFLMVRARMTERIRQRDFPQALHPSPLAPYAGWEGWSVRLDWGFAVLLIGAALVVAAAAVPERPLDNATPGSSG